MLSQYRACDKHLVKILEIEILLTFEIVCFVQGLCLISYNITTPYLYKD